MHSAHDDSEECLGCKEGLGAVVEWEMNCMEKYKFYSHFVANDPEPYANFHTHGIDLSWKHPDFQIVVPMDPKIALDLFWSFVERIKEGERFGAGDVVQKIIKGHDVRLIEAVECGRKVLRIVLPDPQWRFPGDPGCDELYAGQIADIP